MPNPGDRLYKIIDIRTSTRQQMVQVQYETYIVDQGGNNVSTGLKTVRISWNQTAFDNLKTAVAGAVAAEPVLAGWTAI